MTVKITKPELNLREELTKAQVSLHYSQEEFYFTGDAIITTFSLPAGWSPVFVYVDGVKVRKGAAEDFTVTFDGFIYSVEFSSPPGSSAKIDVIATLR